MTDAGWAERKVKRVTGQFEDDYGPSYVSPGDVTKLLRAEHQRAVRVVKREIERVRKDLHSYRGHEKTVALAVLENILAALQKGRT